MLLEGKTGLILGVANKRSIAWGIAQAVSREGARLVCTYQNERLGENVQELASELRDPLLVQCDVASDADIDRMADQIKTDVGHLDFVVHCLAFALREELDGDFLNTSREGYRLAQDISSYSLTAVARRVVPLMEGREGSLVTLSYLGGERVVPHYNVMGVAKAALEMSVRYLAADLGPRGIRVNAISAGPIKTLAASGIKGLSKMLEYHRTKAPLRKNTDQDEVGDAALFLVSRLSRGITGEVLHVDGGLHVLGMAAEV
jgi:enoyl-[acyl-carrier protein] reductase I